MKKCGTNKGIKDMSVVHIINSFGIRIFNFFNKTENVVICHKFAPQTCFWPVLGPTFFPVEI